MPTEPKQMVSNLILRPSTTLLNEQNGQSPDPISMLPHKDHSNVKGSDNDNTNDVLLHADLPSWDTLHISAEQSELGSDIDELDEADFGLHPLNTNLALKTKQIPAGLHDESTTATGSPLRVFNEDEAHTEAGNPALHLCNQASSSTNTAQPTFPLQSPSIESAYSTPPTSHTSSTETTAIQIKHLNPEPRPIRPRSSLIGVIITKPPPRSRTIPQKFSQRAIFEEKSYPDYRSPAPPLIANSVRPLKAQWVNSKEKEPSSTFTSGVRSAHDVEALHPASSQRSSSVSSADPGHLSLSEQDAVPETEGVQKSLVRARNNLPNNESLGISLEVTREDVPKTSLADALMSAFIKNAHQIQPADYPPERRRPPIAIKAVPIEASSSTSSMQMCKQSDQRQSYIRKSKVPHLLNDKGKGRVLDNDEYAELLGADVTSVTFGMEASTTDHVRRSNLRHLQPHKPGVDEDSPDNPKDVPSRFTEPRVSRDYMFLNMLERTFGLDSRWGGGPKPKLLVKSPSISDDSRAVSPKEEDGYETDAEEYDDTGTARRKKRTLDIAPNDDRQSKRFRMDYSEYMTIPTTPAAKWAVLLQGLVKGKVKMNREQVSALSRLLNIIGKVKEDVSFDVALNSKLWRTIRQVSELSIGDIPFEDEHDLRGHARAIASFWSLKWTSKVELD